MFSLKKDFSACNGYLYGGHKEFVFHSKEFVIISSLLAVTNIKYTRVNLFGLLTHYDGIKNMCGIDNDTDTRELYLCEYLKL